MRIFLIVFGLLGLIGSGTLLFDVSNKYMVTHIAAYMFAQDLNRLELLLKRNTLPNKCTSQLEGYQLRFVDEVKYQIEPICQEYNEEQEAIREGTLFGGTKRLFGSGIARYFDQDSNTDSSVQLKYRDKVIEVGLVSGSTYTSWQVEGRPVVSGNQAVARCDNWGFSCCLLSDAVGVGFKATATDCPKTCYQQCVKKPQLLYFNIDPIMDTVKRRVYLRGKQNEVKFGYQIQDDDQSINQVIVDFGDGNIATSNELQNSSLTHNYTCNLSRCEYEVTLSIESNVGVSLTQSSTNRIKIVIDR